MKRTVFTALTVAVLSTPVLASALGSFSGGTGPVGGGTIPTEIAPGGSRCFGEIAAQNRPTVGFGQAVKVNAMLDLIREDVFALQTYARELCREP